MVGIVDVAELAGVSVGTVSNVINGRTDRMAPATQRRVQQAIVELGYQPNLAARFLKTGVTPLIGILVPSIAYPSWSWLIREIETYAAKKYGYRVLIGNTYRDRNKELEFLKSLVSHGIRSVIIVSSTLSQRIIHDGISDQLIAVSYDRRISKDKIHKIDYVSLDHIETMHIAVGHLVENGHQRIALVTVSGKSSSRMAKIKGFLEASASAALSGSSEIIVANAMDAYGDDEMPQLGRQVAEQLVAREDRPTGIVALNDMLAIGLIVGFQRCGLKVPDDVSVIGIDDLLLSAFVSPALTSLRPPVTEMAQTLVDLIIRRLRDPKIEPQERVFIPSLARRESVAKVS
jgi:DNA-binding LacI/PurR family transcriptional regulator